MKDFDGSCSFCGLDPQSVQLIICGPLVCICDDCIYLCLDILKEKNIKPYDPTLRDAKPDIWRMGEKMTEVFFWIIVFLTVACYQFYQDQRDMEKVFNGITLVVLAILFFSLRMAYLVGAASRWIFQMDCYEIRSSVGWHILFRAIHWWQPTLRIWFSRIDKHYLWSSYHNAKVNVIAVVVAYRTGGSA